MLRAPTLPLSPGHAAPSGHGLSLPQPAGARASRGCRGRGAPQARGGRVWLAHAGGGRFPAASRLDPSPSRPPPFLHALPSPAREERGGHAPSSQHVRRAKPGAAAPEWTGGMRDGRRGGYAPHRLERLGLHRVFAINAGGVAYPILPTTISRSCSWAPRRRTMAGRSCGHTVLDHPAPTRRLSRGSSKPESVLTSQLRCRTRPSSARWSAPSASASRRRGCAPATTTCRATPSDHDYYCMHNGMRCKSTDATWMARTAHGTTLARPL